MRRTAAGTVGDLSEYVIALGRSQIANLRRLAQSCPVSAAAGLDSGEGGPDPDNPNAGLLTHVRRWLNLPRV